MSSNEPNYSPRVAMVTNIPAPYRMPIYQRLATILGHSHFHAFFCSKKEDNRDWIVEQKDFSFTFLKENCLTYKGRYIHYNPDILKALRHFNPDVIITTGFNPTHLFAFGYALFYNKIHIPMTDGTFDTEQTLSGLHRIVRRFVYRYSKVFLGASHGSLRLYDSYGINRERFFQSHLCANNSAFNPPDNSKRTFDLMFSGRFVTEKNPLFALDVALGVAKTLNRKVSILMLGSGPILETVRDYANTLAPQIEAIFPGFVQQAELPSLYCSAKLFLFPTSIDTWGVVANEACAAGQAVIVTPYAGVAHELVCDGKNGYVLELDLALWIKHASAILGNEDTLEEFSKNSLLNVQAYNYDAAAKGIVDAVFAAKV
jgi:glycosyltransferase involved in cell wall biosynthesis